MSNIVVLFKSAYKWMINNLFLQHKLQIHEIHRCKTTGNGYLYPNEILVASPTEIIGILENRVQQRIILPILVSPGLQDSQNWHSTPDYKLKNRVNLRKTIKGQGSIYRHTITKPQ